MSAKILKMLTEQASALGLTAQQLAAVSALAQSAQKAQKGASENDPMLDRLEYAKKRRELALHRAKILLDGADGKTVKGQGRGGVVLPVDVRIANLQSQLANLEAAKLRAMERIANLPDDIATLSTAYDRAKAGETVSFPDITPLDDDAQAIHHDKSRVVELEHAEREVSEADATADLM